MSTLSENTPTLRRSSPSKETLPAKTQKHLTEIMLLLSGILNAAARAEDPAPEKKEESTATSAIGVPGNIPQGFLEYNQPHHISEWVKLKQYLEKLAIDPGNGRMDYTIDTCTIEEEWKKAREMLTGKKPVREQDAIFTFPHAYGSMSAEQREGKTTFTIAIKRMHSLRVFPVQAGWSLGPERKEESFVHAYNGGSIQFNITDHNGKKFPGRTGVNGVGMLECDDVTFPCTLQFLGTPEPEPEEKIGGTRGELVEEDSLVKLER